VNISPRYLYMEEYMSDRWLTPRLPDSFQFRDKYLKNKSAELERELKRAQAELQRAESQLRRTGCLAVTTSERQTALKTELKDLTRAIHRKDEELVMEKKKWEQKDTMAKHERYVLDDDKEEEKQRRKGMGDDDGEKPGKSTYLATYTMTQNSYFLFFFFFSSFSFSFLFFLFLFPCFPPIT